MEVSDLSHPSISSQHAAALQDLRYTLEHQPVKEVREKVFGFVDKLLDKTVTLSEDRIRMYEQLTGNSSNSNLTTDLSGAVADLKRSFELQAEILDYHQRISPTVGGQQQEQNVPEQNQEMSPGDKIEALLQQNHHQVSPSLVRQRTTSLAQPLRPPHPDSAIESPRLVKNKGVFAAYSLFLWFLGIMTTLSVIEYVSVADWTAMDVPAIANLVY